MYGNPDHPYFNKPVEIIDPEELRQKAMERIEKKEKILSPNKESKNEESQEEEKKPA